MPVARHPGVIMKARFLSLSVLFAFCWLFLAAAGTSAADQEPVLLNISYQGAYYDNQWLQNEPVFTRTDPSIDFNWGGNSPDGRIENDFFSVRWTSSFYLAEPTMMRFYARADDGIRILVNGQAVLNAYYGEAKPGFTTTRQIPAGTHKIEIEYYEYNGSAYAEVDIFGLDGTPLPSNPGTYIPPTDGGNGNCTIPATGPWPPCATNGGSGSTGGSCDIPASGPWPPCATNGNNGGTNSGNCTIPESGPWPPCATTGGGGQTVDNGCVIPSSGPWPACAR